jgi:hypothetical protein
MRCLSRAASHALSSCDLGGEPHDAVLWLAGHDGATLNTEKQYPYVSGETGKLTKCSPKLDGVATGGRALLQPALFGSLFLEEVFCFGAIGWLYATIVKPHCPGVTGYVNVSNGNETLLAMAMTVTNPSSQFVL